MSNKQKWWERLESATRNITASMDATDADVRDLADRVAALERSISSELDAELLDFGLWLSEELTGRPISRADLESCLTDWKASR